MPGVDDEVDEVEAQMKSIMASLDALLDKSKGAERNQLELFKEKVGASFARMEEFMGELSKLEKAQN